MSNKRYQGDPRIYLGPNGSFFSYKGGQPEMDRGFENLVNIQLLTYPGWCGNIFLQPESKIGSNFLSTAKGTITIDKLNDIKQIAEKVLRNQAFGKITTNVINPERNFLIIEIIIEPPGQDVRRLTLLRNWNNWIEQSEDPAYRRE